MRSHLYCDTGKDPYIASVATDGQTAHPSRLEQRLQPLFFQTSL